MILYINCCVRAESRTHRIATALLDLIGQNDDIEQVRLSEEKLNPLTEEMLEYRTKLIAEGKFDNAMFNYSRQFANADIIVISAPYWDFSFPSILKVYIENIYVTGIVSEYGSDGRPKGLCKAKKLYYVTTAGGAYVPDYSYDYIKALANQHFGIDEVKLIKAEMLDVYGYNADEIVESVIASLT